MKNILLIILSVFIIASCDVINGEVRENVVDPIIIDTTINDTSDAPDFSKFVLLEEYTGHLCGNCPGAARELSNFKTSSNNKDRIVTLAIHAGALADPKPDFLPDPDFKYDFTTDVGDALAEEFGGTTLVLPILTVNRTGYNGNVLVDPLSVSAASNVFLNDDSESPAAIMGTPAYDEANNAITINVKVLTQEVISENVKLSVYVSEDSIVNWQRNYATGGDPLYPTGDIDFFVHMHTFRGSMNGTYGTLLNSASGTPIESGSEIANSYSYLLDDEVIKNCNVIAFVHNESNFDIIQVREWHMRDFID